MTTTILRRGYLRILLIVAAVAIVGVLHLDTVRVLVGMWGEEHHTQSYLIPPIFLYLLWDHRRELGEAPEGRGWTGVLAALSLTVLWIVAQAVAIQLVAFVAVVLMATALTIAMVGWPAYRTAWFPLAFLLASVPAGSEALPALMQFTANISEFLLRLSGVPFHRERMYFELPGGSFEVAEVCAGLRYLSAAVTVGLLFCYLSFRSPWRWLVFMGATVVAFILANGLRAFITMWVSSETRFQDFTGPAHVWMGRALFFGTILAMFWAGRRFGDLPPHPSAAAVAAPTSRIEPGRAHTVAAVVLSILFIAAGPWIQAHRTQASSAGAPAMFLPAITACAGPTSWQPAWTPGFKGADQAAQGAYDCDGREINVFVATYLWQEQGKELVSEMNRVLPPGLDKIAARGVASFTGVDGATVPVNTRELMRDDQVLIVWYWYSAGMAAERSGFKVKLREAVDALLLRTTPASIYVVVAAGDEGDRAALHDALANASREVWEDARRRGTIHEQR